MEKASNYSHTEAERALIASLFNDAEARDAIFDSDCPLEAEHFALRILGVAFSALRELYQENEKPEIRTLIAMVERRGEKLKHADRDMLVEICATLEPTVALQSCVQIIVAKAIARESEGIVHELSVEASDAVDADQINVAIDRTAERLLQMQDGLLSKARKGARPIDEFLTRSVEKLDELQNRDSLSALTGVPFGLVDLDEATTGMHPGDLIVIGARPSMGKTAFATKIMEAAARYLSGRQGNAAVVANYSLEMPGEQMANRLLASVGRIDLQAIRTGKLNDADWSRLTDAIGKLHMAPIAICDEPGVTAGLIRHDLTKLRRRHGEIGLVIVDYLQLMSTERNYQNRAEEIGEISRQLKRIAMDFDCPVIAVSQLNRALEQRPNKRPMMSDLRESGQIEQDADIILFLYRDEVYNPDTADKGKIEIIIAKQRNGPLTMIQATFLGNFVAIENYASGGF